MSDLFSGGLGVGVATGLEQKIKNVPTNKDAATSMPPPDAPTETLLDVASQDIC